MWRKFKVVVSSGEIYKAVNKIARRYCALAKGLEWCVYQQLGKQRIKFNHSRIYNQCFKLSRLNILHMYMVFPERGSAALYFLNFFLTKKIKWGNTYCTWTYIQQMPLHLDTEGTHNVNIQHALVERGNEGGPLLPLRLKMETGQLGEEREPEYAIKYWFPYSECKWMKIKHRLAN